MPTRSLVLLCALVVAAQLIASDNHASPVDGDAEALLERAQKLTDAGDFERSLPLYIEACDRFPRHPMGFRGAGFALKQLGRPEEAIPYLETATRLDPTATKPVQNLGLAHSEVYDNTVAELRHLESQIPSTSLKPDHPLMKRRAELSAKLKDTDWRAKAIEYLRQSVRMAPNEALYWYHLGTTLNQYGREPEEAIRALTKAVELEPNYRALRNLSLSLYRQQRLPEARETALRLERVASPEDPAVPLILGEIAYAAGDWQSAERYMLKTIVLDPRSRSAHLALAHIYRSSGKALRSQEYLEKTVKLDPINEEMIRQEFEASRD